MGLHHIKRVSSNDCRRDTEVLSACHYTPPAKDASDVVCESMPIEPPHVRRGQGICPQMNADNIYVTPAQTGVQCLCLQIGKKQRSAKNAKTLIRQNTTKRFSIFASFAFLFRASCPSPLLHPSMDFALRASLRLFKFDPVEFVGPHFVRSKIFQKFLSRTNNMFNICIHLWI